jgi:Xaa-Pro aminopeptidase
MINTENGTEWGPPFSVQEYKERLAKVRRAMAERKIDLLFVSSPPNITYLTGYDSIWYRRTTPTGLFIRADQDKTLFVDSESHTDLVKSGTGRFDEAIFVARRKYEPAVDTILDTLKGRGWLKGTAAVERWSLAPHGIVLTAIEQRMAAQGCTVVDGSWLVDRVKMVKSPAEIAYMRKAAEIADHAMTVVTKEMKPGMTEIEIQGLAQYVMSKHGGEEPAIRTAVRTGPRGAVHHTPPSRRKIQKGDIIWVDFSGSYHRYHADLARIFSLGEPDKRWIDLYEKAAKSIEVVIKEVRPGDPMVKLHEVANAYIEQADLKKYVWLVGGYDMGIAIPPDWVGHTFHSGLGFEAVNFEPGMTTNYENVFDIVMEDWPGGKGGSYIDMLLMTDKGLEVLSKLDRRMIVLDA